MKKVALIVVVAIGFVAWVALWFRDKDAVAISAAQPWPGEMGTLYTVGDRWPPQRANVASVKLTALANALPKNEAVEDFVGREITRGELTISEPTALPDVSAIREMLLSEPVTWERHDEIGNQEAITTRAMQMTVARALVANALMKARANDPAAWDDLHAVWKLTRTLDGHPQMMAQTAALAMARMINAVAWKMPLPAAAWLGDLQARDNVQRCSRRFSIRLRLT